MKTWKLLLEYQGTRYAGWQAQKNADAVANHVEKAARAVFAGVAELQAAGRTDAGVHALGQVAHLRAERPRNPRANLRLALNDLLPEDIAVLDIKEAPPGFHARHDAKERVYLYQILKRRSAFHQGQAWWVKDKLDVPKMKEAAHLLQGRHDFSSFCDKDPEKPKDTHCEMRAVAFDNASPSLLQLRFGADHFLWKQVRRMAGFLVEVGRGRYKPADAKRLLSAPSRELAPYTAPPAGLFLEAVKY